MRKENEELSAYETRKISRVRQNMIKHQKNTKKENDLENFSSTKKDVKNKLFFFKKHKKENEEINIEKNSIVTEETVNKKKTNVRPKASKLVSVLSIISCLILLFMILGIIAAGIFAYKLCDGIPEFKKEYLESTDSSTIYDADGNEVIELGLYLRENIEYENIPTCVVDAFISIEDSRFFEHFGFDIPRFTMAALKNIKSGNFSQGGSTITMQLVKNSYFQVDNGEDSTIADRNGMSGVQRKMQEIVLSIEADKELSKQEIFALFINKVNFGDNIRGIQKASEYYFGKDAKDLSLNEAAFLAGIINSPNSCNPYNEANKNKGYLYVNSDINYLENANIRKNEVLNLMANHGYITEEEAKLNKNVRVENLLAGKNEKFRSTNPEYQSYIDAVINEVEEVTGKNPYETPMNIYTSMDGHMQKFLYDMQNTPEMYEQYYKFRNDLQQNALVVLNNQTGELVALGGGRYKDNSARQFNRATDAYINPGSSIKPILEYALCFEKLGWATSHTITDQPVFMYGNVLIGNAYGQKYTGDMLITEALARSLNTPAVQALEAVIDEIGEEEVIKYCQSIGLSRCNTNTFDLQWAIGGRDCTVTPVQLAAAHAVLMNDGQYIKPHTVTRIEFTDPRNTQDDYVADTKGTQVLSPEAAWMTAYCENYNVTSGWISQLNRLQRDYPTYAKTGTTNFSDESYIRYHIPESGAKDQWLLCQTSNYTITVWNGFDKLEDHAFFTYEDENYNMKCKMGSVILDELYDHFKYSPTYVEKPDGVKSITHVRGTFPYAEGGDEKGYIKADSPYAKLIPLSEVKQEVRQGRLTGMSGSVNEEGIIDLYWAGFGGYNGDGTMDISASNLDGSKVVVATGRCYFPRIIYTKPDVFYATITSASGESVTLESYGPYAQAYVGGGGPYKVCGWTSADPNQKCNTFN